MHKTIADVVRLESAGDRTGVMIAWFGLAAVLNERNLPIPPSWRYRPSPLFNIETERAESITCSVVLDALDAGELNYSDVTHAGNVIERWYARFA